MKFSLLKLDELEPTLNEVLAFIDDFDDGTSSCSSNSDVAINPLQSKRQQPSRKSSTRWPGRCEWKRRRKAASSRRTHQRRRAELLGLREEVKVLETSLDELRGIWHHGCLLSTLPTNIEPNDDSTISPWAKRALLQRRLQLQAELKNRKLKAAIARHCQMASTLSQLAGATLQDIEEDLSNDNAACHNLANYPQILEVSPNNQDIGMGIPTPSTLLQ